MTEVIAEDRQTIAPSANGKSPDFESGDVGSIPTGASIAPIDRCDAVPVPGKDGAFILIDRVTGEPFNVSAAIADAYASGSLRGK